ncbi:MAG TPA: hypothetical protein V6C91_16230 [Coleofasciculaceae cyanobacterium]
MNPLLNSIRSLLNSAFPTQQQPQPTIDSYGQHSSGLPEPQIQSLMEWLFLSLVSADYWGNSHLIWYDDANPNPDLEQALNEAINQQEPTFLFRVGDRTLSPPTGYYWRMITEHPSTRLYQLEVTD